MSNILIVDDESGIRDSLRGVLDDEGFRTEEVTAVKPASRLLEASGLRVVLLDVWLPGMDGLEL